MRSKSIVELRGIAQAMGCKWGFGDDKDALIQKIETSRDKAVPPAPMVDPPLPPDQRLRSKPPAKVSENDLIMELMKPYIDLGLRFSISEDGQTWAMSVADREDSGTMRQPPRNVIKCAQRILK